MNYMHFITAVSLASMLAVVPVAAQDKNDFNPVQTGVNSLSIAPDARGASMGDLGSGTRRNMPLPTAGPVFR